MNKPNPDLAPRYVPTKFNCDESRIAPRRAVTGLAGQNNKNSVLYIF